MVIINMGGEKIIRGYYYDAEMNNALDSKQSFWTIKCFFNSYQMTEELGF